MIKTDRISQGLGCKERGLGLLTDLSEEELPGLHMAKALQIKEQPEQRRGEGITHGVWGATGKPVRLSGRCVEAFRPWGAIGGFDGLWVGADRLASTLVAGRVGDVLGIPDVDRS